LTELVRYSFVRGTALISNESNILTFLCLFAFGVLLTLEAREPRAPPKEVGDVTWKISFSIAACFA